MDCGTFYSTTECKSRMETELRKALNNNKLDDFFNRTGSVWGLKNGTVVTLVSGEGYDEKAVMNSYREYYNDVTDYIKTYDRKKSTNYILEAQKKLPSVINMADGTQVNLNEVDLEEKTVLDEIENNATTINDHIADFYGKAAYGIEKMIKEDFSDSIFEVAFFNANTGELSLMDDSVLNSGIRVMKSRIFKNIVEYLKKRFGDEKMIYELSDKMFNDSGELNEPNYSKVMAKYYSKTKGDESFVRKAGIDYSSRMAGSKSSSMTTLYRSMMSHLLGNSDFVEAFEEMFEGSSRRMAQLMLFDGKEYSKYYSGVMKIINDLNLLEKDQDVKDYVNALSGREEMVLSAAESYTMLKYFDNYLKETLFEKIKIKKGMEGIESNVSDKYKYGKEMDHHKKSWQQEESNDSTKHISKFAEMVIRSVRIRDYRTGEYMQRRLDPSLLAISFGNLAKGIENGMITFPTRGRGKEVANVTKEFLDCITRMHSDPFTYVQRMFELLFDTEYTLPDGVSKGRLIDDMKINFLRTGVSKLDLSVLKSVYDMAFNKKSSNSLYTRFINDTDTKKKETAKTVINELAGFIDRNESVDYLSVVYDKETNMPTVVKKARSFSDPRVNMLQRSLNGYQRSIPMSVREKIISKDGYDFKYGSNEENNLALYSVKIGDERVGIGVNKVVHEEIFSPSIKAGEGGEMFFTGPEDYFKGLDDVNINTFSTKVMSGSEMSSSNEKRLLGMLKFIEDTLGIPMLKNPAYSLKVLELYMKGYSSLNGMTNSLEPLFVLAMRSAYASTNMYNAAMANNGEGVSLEDYLESIKDEKYNDILEGFKTNVFNNETMFGYRIASYSDEVLRTWVDAETVVNGDQSKATVKNVENASIANASISSLAGKAEYYAWKEGVDSSKVKSLLFNNKKEGGKLLGGTVDLEVTNFKGESKLVRNFSTAELYYHSIFDKFYGRYLNNGDLVIQPTCYSDKTTFHNWFVSTKVGGKDVMTMNEKEIINLYINSIGKAAQSISEEVDRKLQVVTDEWARARNDFKINGKSAAEMSVDERMRYMTEKDLVDCAQKTGEAVELTKDYIVSNGHVMRNPIVRHTQRIYSSPDLLANALAEQKKEFVKMLQSSGSYFNVLDGKDTIAMYTSQKVNLNAKSHNNVIETILGYYSKLNDYKGRISFFENWVDAETGRMIIAKADGKNICGMSDLFSDSAKIELNPLLDKFFFVEGLFSNNLRLSLTGFEYAHASGKGDPLSKLRKSLEGSAESFIEEYGKDYYGSEEKAKEILTKKGEANKIMKEITNVLHEIESAAELEDMLESNEQGKSFKYKKANVSAETAGFLRKINERTMLYLTNTAQGTQFKRNVIVPATLQYVMQNTKEGVPAKIKVSVIRDYEAPVFNYRGDHEGKIKAQDGGAFITPFESIMENRSLGSQAVGNTKKPIWHSYDINGGTAFLGKFATYTMTNSMMRESIDAKSSLEKLFKKMTNLQWDSGDNIDLMNLVEEGDGYVPVNENSTKAESRDSVRKYKQRIFDGKRIYYTDKNGEIVEITGLGKSSINGRTFYYTDEKVVHSKTGEGSVIEQRRIYHAFYDRLNKNGELEKSLHIASRTLADANKLDELEKKFGKVHTINSLYELHSALGGIMCCDLNGKTSENNNEVIVNLMNNIGQKIEGAPQKGFVDQSTYTQTLKKYHIGYALNNSAVKNGAKNINQASAWYDNNDLTYFELDSDGLGIQLNAEHDVVNSELTEFTQVIAACAAYGHTFGNSYELFNSLAAEAKEESSDVTEAAERFLERIGVSEGTKRAEAISDLYDVIVRIMFVNGRISNKEDLTNIIMEGVRKAFGKYTDHTNDLYKMPFSDSNIFGNFISTIASTITKNSIKRKHPGTGNVICPGYNMMQYYEVYGKDGKLVKLMATDVIKRAREAFHDELVDMIKKTGRQTIDVGKQKIDVANFKLYELVDLARKNGVDLSKSRYYSNLTGAAAERHLMRAWLNEQSRKAPKMDMSYFMPSDVVDVFDGNGKYVETVALDDMDTYYRFKDMTGSNGKKYKDNYIFKVSVTSPRNLRPSTIRAQYVDKNGLRKYVNVFDFAAIKQSYLNNVGRDVKYREKVQSALLDLNDRGEFEILAKDKDGNDVLEKHTIIAGTLENESAEIIQGDIYGEKFGTEGRSLADILEEGESFFLKKVSKFQAPKGMDHDIVFLNYNGNQTLVTVGALNNDDVIDYSFEKTNEKTDENGVIWYCKKGKKLFQIGAWVDDTSAIYNESKKCFESSDEKNTAPVDQWKYRTDQSRNGQVQKRVDLIKRYRVPVRKVGLHNKIESVTYNTVFKIAEDELIKQIIDLEATNGDENEVVDAVLQAKTRIIKGIYDSDKYGMVAYNASKDISDDVNVVLKSVYETIMSDKKTNAGVRNMLAIQLESIGNKDSNVRVEALSSSLEEFRKDIAHKQYVSFLDSHKFIASRIPAQSLQSFMTMKLVGWTGDSSNNAFVSHFQTYLQGSDYDIDKAYVMGQSYDENSTYIGWSKYFDYSSLATLEASKKLSTPKKIKIYNQPGARTNITSLIDQMISSSNKGNDGLLNIEGKSEADKVKFLNALAEALSQAEMVGGVVSYDGSALEDDVKAAIDTMNEHESYEINENDRSMAFKNSSSSNIYLVSSDIRNRDYAYTAITMDDTRNAAGKSAKGMESERINLLNPLSKYNMQRQNLVGKGVVGITANGVKYWFNSYYYTLAALKSDDPQRMKYIRFSTELNQVKGRAKADGLPEHNRVTHLPDLALNEMVKEKLMAELGATESSMEYKYVDDKLSQLLSAATDNAKELILARLNASSELARMYIYLLVTGYDLDDIAAFMTSPIGDLASTITNTNFYLGSANEDAPFRGINMLGGRVSAGLYLHGKINIYDETENGKEYKGSITKSALVRRKIAQILNHSENESLRKKALKYIAMASEKFSSVNEGDSEVDAVENDVIESDSVEKSDAAVVPEEVQNNKAKDKIDYRLYKTDDLMQGFILALVDEGKTFEEYVKYKNETDKDFKSYYRKVANVVRNLVSVREQYESKYGSKGFTMLLSDIGDFTKIYSLSSEVSRSTTAFLSLNQGLPTSEKDILKKEIQIKKVFSTRENELGVKDEELFKDVKSDTAIAQRQHKRDRLVDRIIKNNTMLGMSREEIWEKIETAHNRGMINNIDVYKLLTDRAYWDDAKEYLNLLRGTYNILDMVDNLPHYREIINEFGAMLVGTSGLAVKSRIINKMMAGEQFISDEKINGILNFADATLCYNFIKQLHPLTLQSSSVLFDSNLDAEQKALIEFGKFEDIMSFKKFFETDFLAWLNAKHSNNPLVKHLILSEDNHGRPFVRLDFDLSAVDTTATSMMAYNEALEGMRKFEDVVYAEGVKDENGDLIGRYSVADIFQIYNIMQNYNRYGSERLTSLFKVNESDTSVLSKFHKFEGALDNDPNNILEYNEDDYEIFSAPYIYESQTAYHREPYVWVKNNLRGYVLKKFDYKTNSYVESKSMPEIVEFCTDSVKKKQRINVYKTYNPFNMPNQIKKDKNMMALCYEGDKANDEEYNGILSMLNSMVFSRKVSISYYGGLEEENANAVIEDDGKKMRALYANFRYDKVVDGVKVEDGFRMFLGYYDENYYVKRNYKLISNEEEVVYDLKKRYTINDLADYLAGKFGVVSKKLRKKLFERLSESLVGNSYMGDTSGLYIALGNSTLDDVFKEFPDIKSEFGDITSDGNDGIIILRCDKLEQNYSRSSGHCQIVYDNMVYDYFVVDSAYSARNMVKYIKTRNLLNTIFDSGLDAIDTGKVKLDDSSRRIINDLVEYYSRMFENKDQTLKYVKEKILNYIDTGEKIKEVFKTKDGRVLPITRLFNDLLANMSDMYDSRSDLTDFEFAIDEISKNTKGENNRMTKRYNMFDLYNVLSNVVPGFAENMPIERFVKMDAKAMNELLVGKDGLFIGEPTLQRAVVIHSGKQKGLPVDSKHNYQKLFNESETYDDESSNLTHSDMEKVWSKFVEAAKEKYPDFKFPDSPSKVKDVEDKAEFVNMFNSLNLVFEGGENSKIESITYEASRKKDSRGIERVSYRKKAKVKVDYADRAKYSEVILEFPYAAPAKLFGIEIGKKHIFTTVNDAEKNITNGEYNGKIIYVGTSEKNGKIQYAVTSQPWSPNVKVLAYTPTLAEAMKRADKSIENEIIKENMILEGHMVEGGGVPRNFELENKSIWNRSVFRMLDYSLYGKPSYSKLDNMSRKMLGMSVKDFQKIFKKNGVSNIEKINTGEKCALFLYMLRSAVKGDVAIDNVTKSRDVENLASNLVKYTKSKIDGIINEISNLGYKNFFVERMGNENKYGRKEVTVSVLEEGTSKLDQTGTLVGSKPLDVFLSARLNDTVEFIRNKYGLDVEAMSTDQLKEYSRKNNLGFEDKADTVKAFIHNGKIIVNTSKAKSNDVCHEVAHLFIGVLKLKSRKDYEALKKTYRTKRNSLNENIFDKKKYSVLLSGEYNYFAKEDIEDETLARMIADEIDRSNGMALRFEGEVVNNLFEKITKTFDSFTTLKHNGEEMPDFLRRLISENSSELTKQRQMSNLIREMIENSKYNAKINSIIENC